MSETDSRLRIFDSTWQALLLLLPTLSFLLAFLYWPFAETIWLSLHETTLIGEEVWVGLEHYVDLATSADYRWSVFVTVAFAALTVSISMLIALVISFLIYEVDRWSGAYLVAAIWPYALPLSVAAVILELIVHPELGIVTYAIQETLGLEFNWYLDGRLAFLVITLAAIWQGLGYSIIFITAALGQLPYTITEAAELDGVSKFDRLFRIYVPLISPTLVFLLVVRSVSGFFGGFALVDLMTDGGPGDATNILIYNLYIDAFEYSEFGYAAAQSVILFGFVAILMVIQLRVSEKYAYYGGA
ncbi:carbohydrate ABC transporter permease [Halopiger goleimassiliensis]|uniref:carbohydrate ABC transporter permease n=1 Tax=Halopiger goleimassiliensis TaxID=1293048 RepID=UPI000677DA2E|nr:sugar ABC transporter permease [Halopiger goleimassiliensis]